MHAAQIDYTDFATRLVDDIAANRVRLPTLPDVALRVRDAVEAESSAPEIAKLISQDIAMSGRLLQVANSALYRGAIEVDSIQMAVTRLGTKLVRSLIVSLAMKQIFKPTSGVLTQYFRGVWEDSIEVAATSRILAADLAGIDPEQAMLGGLLYNIGALPVLARLGEEKTSNIDAPTINGLIDKLAPDIGAQILTSWHFPEILTAIPMNCLDLQRDSGPNPDYVDIVLAARLQHFLREGRMDMAFEWGNLPAFEKLGIHVEVVVIEQDDMANWARDLRCVLDG